MASGVTEAVTGRFPTLCGMCGRYVRCGMYVTVVAGKITAVEPMPEHIGAKGFFCFRAFGAMEFQYSPQRLTHPMKKVRSEFQRCSWDESLDTIVEKLNDVKSKYGAESVAVYLGQIMTPMMKHVKRFCDLFGTPNMCSAASYCNYSAIIAHVMTYGGQPVPDAANSKAILVCGTNPATSDRMRFNSILEAKQKGAKVVVVDPRRTETSKLADIYTTIRPGTDLAFGLSLLNVVISENLWDKEFVEQYTIGFNQLTEHIKQYSPEWAEKLTWIPADTIREIARLVATTKPSTVITGISQQHATNGCQAVRSFSILSAICGNLDLPGGTLLPVGRVQVNSFRVKERFPKIKGIGVEKFPLHFQMASEANAITLQDTIIRGKPYPIKAMLIQGGNPVTAWPNANRTVEALKDLDFLAVMELRMTDTAKLADLVLPAASFFERTTWEMWPILAIQNRVIEPTGECWPDWKFWFELGHRFGWGEYYPWKSIEEAIDWELEPTGVGVQRMRDNPQGFRLLEWSPKRYLKTGFNTPSKRVEIYSERMKNLGYAPMPTYHESEETPLSKPELVKEYPLILTTGARVLPYNHSEFRECPSLILRDPKPRVEINPQTAKSLGVKHDDAVWVETLRGRTKLSADVTDIIDPRVVEVKHGWSAEANANILTDHAQDPISGFPAFRVSLCKVYKAG
jgi:anaerobic selenocysteine-containing dehydrogenase